MSEKMQNATMRINLITVFSVFWNDRSIILLSILSFLGCGLIFNEFGRSTYVSTTPIKDGATAIGNLHFGLINTYLKASEDELIDPNHVASPGFTEQSVHTNYLRELSRLLERDFASRIGDKVNPLARNVRLEKKSQAGWFVLAETKNSAAWLQRLERIDQEMSAIMLQKIMRQVQAIHVQQDIARGFKN